MKSYALLPGLALGLLLAAQPAFATEYAVLIKAKKYAEAEKLATSRLAQDPANAAALAGRAETILASGDGKRTEEAIQYAEQCIGKNPASAACHLALGKALGTKAMSGGMLAAARSAGTIRDSFKKAVELDPRNLDARFSLLQFYMMAPGFMGGGVEKAQTMLAQTAALHPEAGKLMAAMVDASQGRLANAEAAAAAAQPGADEELKKRHESLYINIGSKYMSDKKNPDGERVFRQGLKRFPDSDMLPLAVARSLQEQGKHRDALPILEQLAIDHPRASVHYRMAQSLQALGEKPKAIAAFQKALAAKPALHEKIQADAEDQIKSLKG